MNKKQENKLAMLKTVDTYLDENREIAGTIAEFNTNHQQLKSVYNEIMAKDDQKINALKGRTVNKREAKRKVTSAAKSIAGGLFAFGKKSGDNIIMKKADIYVSKLIAMRDIELIEAAESLRNLALEYSDALAEFGISAAKLTAFSSKISEYDNAVGQKQNSIIIQTGATKTLKTLFSEADSVLLSMNKLADSLKDEHPEFVRDYYAARVVKKFGTRYNADEDEKTGDESTSLKISENKAVVLNENLNKKTDT
jgi:hypothetical protein